MVRIPVTINFDKYCLFKKKGNRFNPYKIPLLNNKPKEENKIPNRIVAFIFFLLLKTYFL
tara:strand:+ start:1299 stop:1478 length:180 start_codon:yes stop_codon:yes gene_type:complete